ncbi:MAG: hypothetical protein EBS21_02480 [Sphingomonadaceae bacterium]|nr:hypothetical protein [Sphingomonadaceae bacterium]
MTWVATAVSVAGTAYGAYSQNKAQQDAKSAQSQAMAAAGRIPDIAAYQPVKLKPTNFQGVQKDTLDGNYNMMSLIQQLMQGNAGINRATSMDRANGFDPSLWGNVGTSSKVAQDWLNGKASWSDSTETVAQSTGLNGSVGTPGTGQALTARDLGLMDMDLRARGAQLNGQAISQADALDPRANYGSPQDWQLTPRETVPWKMSENLQLSKMAMDQAENVYTAEQNGYNLAAGMNPAATAGLAFAGQANKGVDWSQIISGLGSAYNTYKGSSGLNTGGTYNSYSAAKSAAPYAAGYSSSASGYTPKAQVVT